MKSYYQRNRKKIIRKAMAHYYRNRKWKRNAKRIAVTAFTLSGKKVGSFKSIHMFLAHTGSRYKICNGSLKTIRKGGIIMKDGYLVGLSSKFRTDRIDPLRCEFLSRKSNADRNRNIDKIDELYRKNRFIAIIGKNMKPIGYSRQTIAGLAKAEGVSAGTIKKALHKSARNSMAPSPKAQHYVYLKDLPAFIARARKSLHGCAKKGSNEK